LHHVNAENFGFFCCSSVFYFFFSQKGLSC